MRSWMLATWYAMCGAAGAAVAILAGVALKFLDGGEDGTFNVPVIAALSIVALAPLILLVVVWVSGRGVGRTTD